MHVPGSGARAASGGGKAGRSFTGINLRMCTGAAPTEIREVSQGRSGCRAHRQAVKQLGRPNMNEEKFEQRCQMCARNREVEFEKS